MSWSVGAIGKSEAVTKEVDRQFQSSGPCQEPEETVRQAARACIAEALKGQEPGTVVSVSAFGSQASTYRDGKFGPPFTNQLKIEVTPQGNFVE